MADLDKHLNLLYSGTSPLNLGDRYYAQDLIRDLNYSWDLTGQTVRRVLGTFPAVLSGGVTTKGAGDTLNITECFGICSYDVEVPDTFAALPPSKMTVTIARKVHAAAQTNMALAAATLNGIATNYIKLNYAETNGNSRTRARAAGSYNYERVPSYTYVVSTTAPTDYDVVLGTLVGTAGGAFTISQTAYPIYNLKLTQDAVDVIEKKHGITNSAVAVAAYTIADDDNTNDIFADPSEKAFAVNLPTLAANLGRIIRVKVITAGGAVSLTPEGAELLEGVNAAFVMQSSGDHCNVIGQATGWRILSARSRMDTGYINRSDYTNQHAGNSICTYDTLTGTFTVGEVLTEYTDAGRTTPSGVTGIIMSDSGTALVCKNVAGIGVWTNNLYLKGMTSNAVALVNVSTKNVDSDITHNLGVDIDKLRIQFVLSTQTTGTGATSMLVALGTGNYNNRGLMVYEVDTNSFTLQTGTSGFQIQDAGGGDTIIDTEDYSFKVMVERVI